MKNTTIFALALGLALPLATAPAQVTSETWDFEDGTTQGFASITRPDTYDDEPVNVTSSTEFPDAFPLPGVGNTRALSVEDGNSNSFGLASAVGGFTFDRTAPNFLSATLAVDLYVVASAAANEGNVALLAINDGTGTTNEAYYRFGYRNNEVYLQRFNGVAFGTLGQDAAAVSSLTIPGWNRFSMTFNGAEEIILEVNSTAVAFSPVTDTTAAIDAEIQIGALGFNLTSFNPILMDNFAMEVELLEFTDADRWTVYE